MIVAITIILIVAMICGTALIFGYWSLIHTEVNEYTLRDVRELEKEIQRDADQIKVDINYLRQLNEQYIENIKNNSNALS